MLRAQRQPQAGTHAGARTWPAHELGRQRPRSSWLAPSPTPAPARAAGSPPAGPPALARALARSVRARAARESLAGSRPDASTASSPAPPRPDIEPRRAPAAGRATRPLLQRTPADAVLYAQRVLRLPGIRTEQDVLAYMQRADTPAEHLQALQAQYAQSPVGSLVSGSLDTAALVLRYLTGEQLLTLAFASKTLRKQAQDYCQRFLRSYGDRFEFHLATRARLLYDEPAAKYGGRAQMGKPTATSAWNVYTAALTGTSPVVLGPIPNYMPMRDYTQTIGDEPYLKSVEANATYLMTFPWSLLVNAALVTGAIHGRRTIVGAEDPLAADVLFKDPAADPTNNFGLSVYGRELIQLVLVHGYCAGPLPVGLELPKPATSGGLVLNPPAVSPPHPATLFDADELNVTYGDVKNLATLQSELEAKGKVHSGYARLEFDVAIGAKAVQLKKEQAKDYERLRKRLKAHLDAGTGLPLATTPAPIVEMLETVYPYIKAGLPTAASERKPVPSLEGWRIRKYEALL